MISLRRTDAESDAAHALYAALVAQARAPAFYRDLGVPDSLDGRFELIALHAFLVMRRLKAEGAAARALSQRLFDVMFSDLDQSLREMGAGDLGVGRRVKEMVGALYGRIAAYEAGLGGGESPLADALRRNLYGTAPPPPGAAAAMAGYVAHAEHRLAALSAAALRAGQLDFPPIPARPGGSGEPEIR